MISYNIHCYDSIRLNIKNNTLFIQAINNKIDLHYVYLDMRSYHIWSCSPGQHIVCLALYKHFDQPKLLARMCLKRGCTWIVGMIILVPLWRSLSSMVISLQKLLYGCTSNGTSWIWLSYSAYIMCLSDHKSPSCAVAPWRS